MLDPFSILISIISGLLSIGWVVLYGVLKQQAKDVKETAALVLSEKERTVALVMEEKEKAAALIKTEHDKLEEKFIAFRIKVAEDYATTVLVKEVVTPIIDKLIEIERLLHTKLDRHEWEKSRREGQ